MSLTETVRVFRSLQPEDFRVLLGIELGLGSRAYVPKSEISKYANLPAREIEFRLDRLDKLGLVLGISSREIGYDGFVLNYAGYDCLALNALVKSSVVSALGKGLAVGKESDVYEGLTPQEQRLVVKFHRLGRTSFRQGRRKRSYVADRSHITWYYQSRLSAEREFSILRGLTKEGVSVPRPLGHNRHVVVMELIAGLELNDVGEVEQPRLLLKQIMSNIRLAYTKAGLIHADLSKFNIVVTPLGASFIIDWPQAVKTSHPNADELLRRDLQNVLSFFKKRFGADYDFEKVVSYVQGIGKTIGRPKSARG